MRDFGADAGGIVGGRYDNWMGKIDSCLNNGDISVDSINGNPMSGGIIGNGSMTLNCFNSGDIVCKYNEDGKNANRACGGICAQSYKTVKNCFSIGTVSMETDGIADRCGTIVGLFEGKLDIEGCYSIACDNFKYYGLELEKSDYSYIPCDDGEEFLLSAEKVKNKVLQNCSGIYTEKDGKIVLIGM